MTSVMQSRGRVTLVSPSTATRLLVLLLCLPSPACVVSQRCYKPQDCPQGSGCDEQGRCTRPPLPDGRVPIRCPLLGMVSVADAFCVDIYEASRLDATAVSPGADDSVAMSRKGVLPWQVENNARAEQACTTVGKRLCTAAEWLLACQGPDTTTYSYGNDYHETTCNGIDAFGDPGLWQFKLMPAGSFPGCTNEWGLFDINGNLWEHVAGGSDKKVRGGAYNCGDSRALHRCDYVPGWVPSARGFRCCADGVPLDVDAGPTADLPPIIDSQLDRARDLMIDGSPTDLPPPDLASIDLPADLPPGQE